MNGFTKGLLKFLAVVLCFVFFCMILTSTTLSFGTKVLESDAIYEMVSQVDAQGLLAPGSKLHAVVQEYSMDEPFVEAVLESGLTRQLLEAYFEDLQRIAQDSNAQSKVDAELLRQICQDNMDELTELITQLCQRNGVEAPTKSRVRVLVDEFLFYYSRTVLEHLPDSVKLMYHEDAAPVRTMVQICSDDVVLTGLILGCVFLATGIFFCCKQKKSGLLWIAVTEFISAGAFLALGSLIGFLAVKLSRSVAVAEVLSAISGVIQSHFFMAALWAALAGGVSIGLHVLYKKLTMDN